MADETTPGAPTTRPDAPVAAESQSSTVNEPTPVALMPTPKPLVAAKLPNVSVDKTGITPVAPTPPKPSAAREKRLSSPKPTPPPKKSWKNGGRQLWCLAPVFAWGRKQTIRLQNRLGRRNFFIIAIVLMVTVVGSALGCGLGFGLKYLWDVPNHNAERTVIKTDEHFFGMSPPVYPSPNIAGPPPWADSFAKAQTMVANMTLEEKVSLTSGVSANNGCPGNIPPVRRLDFPGLCLADAGQGLRATDFVSSFPAGISVGASWNKALALQRASQMGAEFRRKGANVLLGPVVGPAGRLPMGGRTWEGFSSDPYLSGVMATQTVVGIQAQGVMASTKHFIGNEQETNRNPDGEIAAVSSNIDDKAMHEIYLWPFQDAVRAGTASIMCSYQRVNNSYGCANSKILNGLLKTELGFQGFVVSDWGAQHAGLATAESGMDMAMPNGDGYWGDKLVEAASNGSLAETRVTDMALRIISSWYSVGADDADFPSPGYGIPKEVTEPHEIVDARNIEDEAREVLLTSAIESHVLVKNINDILPLRQPRMLSIFGYSAKSPDVFAPTRGDLGNFNWEFGAEASDPLEISLGFGSNLEHKPNIIGENGTMVHGGGSGATTPSLFLSPFEAIKARALQDGTALFHDFVSDDPLVSAASDACIVFGNAWASESYDRPALRDDYTDALILNVADQCNKTVVVFHNAGVRLVDQFVEHPNVSAIIFAHLPGQDTGRALVSLLYGDSNPSGKMPYTVPRNESDYGSISRVFVDSETYLAYDHAHPHGEVLPANPTGRHGWVKRYPVTTLGSRVQPDLPVGDFKFFPQSNFTEGIYVDYRHFDQQNLSVRYEFGFGLSYTTFAFGNISVAPTDNAPLLAYPTGEIRPGGHEDLWDVVATVDARVRNTGQIGGAEVAQLYVGIPYAPDKQLRGFDKVFLQPEEEKEVHFNLTRRDLSVWDPEKQNWKMQAGGYKMHVGRSSRDLPLEDLLVLSVN